MNILSKIGGALQTTHAAELESAAVIGLFGDVPRASVGQPAPAFGSFSRRRSRARKQ